MQDLHKIIEETLWTYTERTLNFGFAENLVREVYPFRPGAKQTMHMPVKIENELFLLNKIFYLALCIDIVCRAPGRDMPEFKFRRKRNLNRYGHILQDFCCFSKEGGLITDLESCVRIK